MGSLGLRQGERDALAGSFLKERRETWPPPLRRAVPLSRQRKTEIVLQPAGRVPPVAPEGYRC
jgi:hypothetical protein